MRRCAVILAAHGSHRDPTANSIVISHAARIRLLQVFDEVFVAFHQGLPSFASVLDTITADDVVVVPVMTSDGYYCNKILPNALRTNARFGALQPIITPPVGTHGDMVALVHSRVVKMLRQYKLESDRTTLVLIGHGTERHERSRLVTLDLAREMRRMSLCTQVLSAFLDDKPHLDGVHGVASEPNLIAVPFLIGGGYHASQDIPRRLGMNPSNGSKRSGILSEDGLQWPRASRVGDRRVICDAAIGTHHQIADIVIKLASMHLTHQHRTRGTGDCGAVNRMRSSVRAGRMATSHTDDREPNR